jgi:hypothetical protein
VGVGRRPRSLRSGLQPQRRVGRLLGQQRLHVRAVAVLGRVGTSDRLYGAGVLDRAGAHGVGVGSVTDLAVGVGTQPPVPAAALAAVDRTKIASPVCTTHTGVDPVEPSGRVKPMLISSTSASCRRSPSGIASTFPTLGLPGGIGPTLLRAAVGG